MYCYTEHINQTTMSVNTEAQVTKKWFIWRPIVVSNPIYFTRSYSSFRHNCTLAVKSFDYGLSVPTFLSTSSETLQRMSVRPSWQSRWQLLSHWEPLCSDLKWVPGRYPPPPPPSLPHPLGYGNHVRAKKKDVFLQCPTRENIGVSIVPN